MDWKVLGLDVLQPTVDHTEDTNDEADHQHGMAGK